MKKIINYINDSNSKHFNILLFLILTANLGFNLFFGYNYLMPYGFDEVISIWPIGQELIYAKNSDWLKLIFSKFLSEDHLFAVTNLTSFFIAKLNGDIVLKLYWISRLFYFIILILSVTLAKEFGKSNNQIFLFVAFFLNAGPINFSVLSYNVNFNLVTVFGLATVLFFLRTFNREEKFILNSSFFLFFSILGVFTSENFYIIYPIILSLFVFYLLNNKKNIHLKHIAIISSFLILLLIKFYISLKIIGSLMPKTRLMTNGREILINILSVIFKVFNDILFGLPNYLKETKNPLALIIILLLLTIAIKYVITFKLKSIHLPFMCYLASLPFICFTGRFHPGMWTIVSILGLLFISDSFYHYYFSIKKNAIQPMLILILILPLLFMTNLLARPYSKFKKYYNYASISTNAAYDLIPVNSNKIIVYKYLDSNELIVPIAFWIGNEIQKKRNGLLYKNSEKSMSPIGLNIEYINLDNIQIDYPSLLNQSAKQTTLIKSNNSFIKLNNPSIFNTIYESRIYKNTPNESFDLLFPNKKSKDSTSFIVELNFFEKPMQEIIVLMDDEVMTIKDIVNNKISFIYYPQFLKHKLVVRSKYSQRLFSILIKKHIDSIKLLNNNGNDNINNTISIGSERNIYYKITTSDSSFEFYGNSTENKINTHVIPNNTKNNLLIDLWYFEPRNNKWVLKNKFINKPEKHSNIKFINDSFFISN